MSAALGLAFSPLPCGHGMLPRTPSHHLAILKLSRRSIAPALQATFVSRGALDRVFLSSPTQTL